MSRAVVIDQSAIVRAGLVSVLTQLGVEILGDCDHEVAADEFRDWSAVDLLVVGGVDRGRSGDQFPGPGLISDYRNARRSGEGIALVVSPLAMNPRFRRRLWESGADFAVDPADIATSADLLPLLRGTDPRHRLDRSEPLWNEPALGIERGSRINAFVAKVEELGVQFLHPTGGSSMPPARSRWWLHLRRDLTSAGQLRVVNRDGSIPDRNQTICSIGQLRRVFDWATKISPVLD